MKCVAVCGCGCVCVWLCAGVDNVKVFPTKTKQSHRPLRNTQN